MLPIAQFWRRLCRRKAYDYELNDSNQLSRCLSILDLTALGVGSTLGLGMYILAGQVAATKTGPAIILSFVIAAIASLLAGLCYAEFGARVPKAGSAYVYSYVSVGEFVAFLIGWNMILEYIIGAASVARGYSGYVSAMFGDEIIKAFNGSMHMNIPHLSPYPDFLAFGITMLVSVLLAVGVKASSKFNNVFTAINILIAAFVIVVGSFKADAGNWALTKEQIPSKYRAIAGDGGFMPFGIGGVISGAASCFYAFVGFDIIATTGEEARDPERSTPIAILLSLVVSFVAYFGVSLVQTMMAPYYLQDNEHPLSFVFDYVEWPVGKWIVALGALAGLSSSILGSIFPLPRVVYSMANDGLIFRALGHVSERFKTPAFATLLGGFMGGLMAMLFDVEALTSMMSIGTLLAYTLVAVSILVIRYRFDGSEEYIRLDHGEGAKSYEMQHWFSWDSLQKIVNYEGKTSPNVVSSNSSKCFISIIGLSSVVLAISLVSATDGATWWNILLTVVSVIVLSACTFLLSLQPSSKTSGTFMVPLVPLLPTLSIVINLYLMAALDVQTWIRFSIWMIIGFCIYFGYGIRNSTEVNRDVSSYTIADDEDCSTNVIHLESEPTTPLCQQ